MSVVSRLLLIVACAGSGIAAAAYLATNMSPEVSAEIGTGHNDGASSSEPAQQSTERPALRNRLRAGSGADEVTHADGAAIDSRSRAVTSSYRAPVAAHVVSDAQAVQRHIDLAQTFDILDLKKQVEDLLGNQQNVPTTNPAPTDAAASEGPTDPAAPATPQPAPPSRTPRTSIEASGIDAEGDGKLEIRIQDSDIREVLEILSEQSGLNILASPNVQGRVSAVLQDVDVDAALDAILKSNGYAARRDGKFVFVGTQQDFEQTERSLDKMGMRVYRPNYVSAAELETLITPILTESVGKVTVSTAAETGIGSDANQAGGNTMAGGETVIVQDYETVLAVVDQIVKEVDVRPMQVAIEAMILSVRLSDDLEIGVSWQVLRDRDHLRLGSGTPRIEDLDGDKNSAPVANVFPGAYQFVNGGLEFAFLDSNLGHFLQALETIGDSNVIATPRLMVLNKQRAEILIGAELGYVSTTITETSTAQSVEFLEVGAQLRLRPFISSDGNIRMEVHPELSTGQVRVEEGFTLPDKEVTAVTTNIMVPDGRTLVIGGLMREDLTTTTSQIPLLGNLPAVGWLFRHKDEVMERREIMVLITPHIVYDPETSAEGELAACEFHRRHLRYRDHMSPIGKRLLARKYYDLAYQAWNVGNRDKALRFIHWSIHFDPENRAAIELESTILSGTPEGVHLAPAGVPEEVHAEPLDGEEIPPWVLDALEATPEKPNQPLHPRDPGVPGPQHDIVQPRNF